GWGRAGVVGRAPAGSCTGAGATVRFRVSPTPTRTPVCRASLKPTARADTSYVPSGMSGAMNPPRSLVTTWRWNPVCVSRSTTVAPATAVPDGSVTVPRMTAVVACDWAARATGIRRATATDARSFRSMRLPPKRGWDVLGAASLSRGGRDGKHGKRTVKDGMGRYGTAKDGTGRETNYPYRPLPSLFIPSLTV